MQRLLEFEKTFEPTRKALFIVSDSVPLERSSLLEHSLLWLSENAATLPFSNRVDSLATVSFPRAVDGDVEVTTYLEHVCRDGCSAAAAKSIANDPVVFRRLMSEDRESLAVLVVFDVARNSTEKLAEAANRSWQLVDDFRREFPGLEVRLTGGVPVSQAYISASRKDVTTLFALAGILIFTALWLIFGEVRATLVLLGTALSSIVFCMGIAGWLGYEINSATSTVPIIVLTLVAASCMHLQLHYLRLRESMSTGTEAVKAAVNANALPIALTTFTTAASLASLIFISSPPIRDVGVLASIGLVFGGIATIFGAPLLLSRRHRRNPRFNDVVQRYLNKYARRIQSGTSVSWLTLVLLLCAALGLTRLEINDDFVAYLSEATPVRQHTDFALEHLSGPSHLEILVESQVGSVFAPEFLEELSRLTTEIRANSQVASSVSLADVMGNILVAFELDRDFSIHSEIALSQLFFAYQLGLRVGESATDLVTEDATMTRVSVFLGSTEATTVRRLEEELQAKAQDFQYLSLQVTGENSPVAFLSSYNLPALSKAIFLTLVVTSILLAGFFRSPRIGLCILIAISVPLVCGLGAWGWIASSIGLAGTLIIAISLGVVVDDAIHLTYQQRSALSRGDGAWPSTAYSIHRVGTAIFATTLLFVVGLLPLWFSDFYVNATFAICTTLVLVLSLVFDLGVLPRLLVWASASASGTRDGR